MEDRNNVDSYSLNGIIYSVCFLIKILFKVVNEFHRPNDRISFKFDFKRLILVHYYRNERPLSGQSPLL